MLQIGAAGFGSLLVPFPTLRALADGGADPHFFLQILIPGGADSSYLFDARPLVFAQKNLMQNYTAAEPSLWTGSNGDTAYASVVTDPLKSLKDYFTVINGVLMSGLDGHDQNTNFLMTGNSFGGDSFVPLLNSAGQVEPLDCIQSGSFNSSLTNLAATVPLTRETGAKLINSLKTGSVMDLNDPTTKFILSRMKANGDADTGRFAEGSQNMLGAIQKSPQLADLLRKVNITPSPDEFTGFLQLAGEFFKNGISKAAIISFNDDFQYYDTHDPEHAKNQPEQFKKLVQYISTVFTFLKNTSYDSQKSFLDVTTVMISSEFTRTMKQSGKPIDQTGTDHNPLTNSIIIGGKGIKGGQVIGSSDWQTFDAELSLAHKSFDRNTVKLMGRPFNFTTMKSRKDLPDSYSPKDYLGAGSIINTIYSMFNVSPKQYRLVEKNGVPSPLLKGLLA